MDEFSGRRRSCKDKLKRSLFLWWHKAELIKTYEAIDHQYKLSCEPWPSFFGDKERTLQVKRLSECPIPSHAKTCKSVTSGTDGSPVDLVADVGQYMLVPFMFYLIAALSDEGSRTTEHMEAITILGCGGSYETSLATIGMALDGTLSRQLAEKAAKRYQLFIVTLLGMMKAQADLATSLNNKLIGACGTTALALFTWLCHQWVEQPVLAELHHLRMGGAIMV
jgi:hypothetical protein